jgi:hypothetical protein
MSELRAPLHDHTKDSVSHKQVNLATMLELCHTSLYNTQKDITLSHCVPMHRALLQLALTRTTNAYQQQPALVDPTCLVHLDWRETVTMVCGSEDVVSIDLLHRMFPSSTRQDTLTHIHVEEEENDATILEQPQPVVTSHERIFSPMEQLLGLQYLQAKTMQWPWLAWWSCLYLPLLSSPECCCTDEWCRAVEDALRCPLQTTDVNTPEDPWLNRVLSQLTNYSSPATPHTFKNVRMTIPPSTASRVVKRLYHHHSASSVRVHILEAVTRMSVSCMNALLSHNAASSSTVLLRCLSLDLLPLLVESHMDADVTSHAQALCVQIATHLWSFSSASQDVLYLQVATTVLCILLPKLVLLDHFFAKEQRHTHSMDIQDTTISHSIIAPLDWTRLWSLLYTCCNQGLTVPKQLSWVEASCVPVSLHPEAVAEQEAMCPLLRRRSLYLLRTLVSSSRQASDWHSFVACLETLEMEQEIHLVEQIWGTVRNLCASLWLKPKDSLPDDGLPALDWRWMTLLWSRALTTPDAGLRKQCLYRFLQGQAGIVMPHSDAKSKGAPVSILSTDFVWQIIVPAFDPLETTVGATLNVEVNGKIVQEDLNVLLSDFLRAYLGSLDEGGLVSFFQTFWKLQTIGCLHRKTTVQLFSFVSSTFQETSNDSLTIPLYDTMLTSVVESYQMLFSLGSIVTSYKQSLLKSLAILLSHSKAAEKLKPLSILSTLALFPEPYIPGLSVTNSSSDAQSWINDDIVHSSLSAWLSNLDENSKWALHFGSSVAIAFVDGMLLQSSAPNKSKVWDVKTDSSDLERRTGRAIVLFCTLCAHSSKSSFTASEALWPAIYKGISYAPTATRAFHWSRADRVSRALILLESGCKLQVLSGLGNGDLIITSGTNQMMPPPANIEALLGNAVGFVTSFIDALLSFSDGFDDEIQGGSRSGLPKLVLSTFARQIARLQVFHSGYPSSLALSHAVENIHKEAVRNICSQDIIAYDEVVQTSLLFAAVSCGYEGESSILLGLCSHLVNLQFVPSDRSVTTIQPARSVFQFAKWGTLSLLLSQLFSASEMSEELQQLINEIYSEALDAVEHTPPDAMIPLFDCLVEVTGKQFSSIKDLDSKLSRIDLEQFKAVVDAMCRLIVDCASTKDSLKMLDKLCSLLFQSRLMLSEAERLLDNPEDLAPIRGAFRLLIDYAGKQRPHITRAVLSRIVPGWLGCWQSNCPNELLGLAAIPYRADIVNLLLHKEDRMGDELIKREPVDITAQNDEEATLPAGTDELSIARGFVLVFLSKLPDLVSGLNPKVHTELVQPIIEDLLKIGQKKDRNLVMKGTAQYCLKMRCWQAICILSRFVTLSIANEVCIVLMDVLSELLHGQIRYFVEIFAIQCFRRFPEIFGQSLIKEIQRTDLSLQHISSLMVIAGNLIVGRYNHSFFSQFDSSSTGSHSLTTLVYSVIPWLSSTQGFSRAIAQLLVHKLVPMVMDVHAACHNCENTLLLTIFRYLDTNSEMNRLRKKQGRFFEQYDADVACTPEGILNIPVDEGNEADAVHMVDAIKESLKEVYSEAHDSDAPTWRQIEDLGVDSCSDEKDNQIVDLLNFQRKILPLDALNLALEEEREQRLRNVAGRRRQPLIVCASLVDKVPNLGGLARTAEIFAADRLIVPDLRVIKMDNFKSLSVGAGDWIQIEECREEVSEFPLFLYELG